MPHLHRLCFLIILHLLPVIARAQVSGCTDPAADNYNVASTHNDGSCLYPQTSVPATTLAQVADTIRETSGLLYWNGTFWTHNDDADTALYAIDTADGHIIKRVAIAGAPNHDWEDITQDDDYFYIGDFGNNAAGNRQDLVILRIPKAALLAGQNTVTPDKIFFSYADQTVFTSTGNNNTDFDCEALIATGDSLYLFTKQWVSGKTKLYALPKTPGAYIAGPRAEYNVDGLVAGATYLPAKKTVVLCGYKIAGLAFQPFVCLLYDYTGSNFFSGNKRKILVTPPYHQTEGLATIDGRRFFITNEKLSQSGITITPKLQQVDLSPFLSAYYASLGLPMVARLRDTVAIYPNPARHYFSARLRAEKAGRLYVALYNASGQQSGIEVYQLHAGNNEVRFKKPAALPPGSYFVKLAWDGICAWGRVSLYE